MTVVRFEPLRELSSLQNEMNRLFNTVFDTPPTGANRRWVPAMDLVETADAFVLRADLPGMTQDDVKLEVEDSVLTVSGERKASTRPSRRASTASSGPSAPSRAPSRSRRACRPTP